MLIRQRVLDEIRDGNVDLQFRRWRRATVKVGGTLMTTHGQLAIEAVEVVDVDKITAAQAKRAGYPDRGALLDELARHRTGDLYRVRVRFVGGDPRNALREEIPVGDELEQLVDKVRAFDERSTIGPWAVQALTMIHRSPALRAGDLADEAGMEKKDFKSRVRKLKALGLTESLEIGYRLSPRGTAVLQRLRGKRK